MPRLVAVAVMLITLMASEARAAEWSRTYDVGSGATLRLRADDATVHVAGWSEPRIQIDVETDGWTIGPGGLRLVDTRDGDCVEFALREPAFEFHFGLVRRSARIDVHVPERTTLDVHTGDGDVTCETVSAPVRISTGDGRVTVSSLAGELDLHTSDGAIEAWNVDGALTASTGDGRVRIRGRFDALDVSSADGGVTVDVAPGSHVRPGWRVRTADGPIALRLASDLQATLNAHTGDGRLTVDLPVTVIGPMRDNELHGRINGGGAELGVRTGDGSILIEPFVEDAARPMTRSEDGAHDHVRRRARHLR